MYGGDRPKSELQPSQTWEQSVGSDVINFNVKLYRTLYAEWMPI